MKSIALLISALVINLFASAQADLKPVEVYPVDYLPIGTHSFDVTVLNIGTTTVTSFKICWRINNGPVTEATPTAPTYPLAGNMMNPARTRGNFTISFTATGTYKLKVWTKTVSVPDNNNTNDTIVKTVKVMNNLPVKNVLMEVFKHQACCPCFPAANYEDTAVAPLANYFIANIYTSSTDVIYNKDGDTVNDVYGLAHPNVFFDRYKFPHAYTLERGFYTLNNDYFLTDMHEREKYYEPVSVTFSSGSYNSTTRLLKVKLKAKFYDTVAGDLRFNLYLTEDSIKAWQGCAIPDPYDYYHMRVLRVMLGGPWGLAGAIPSVVYPGDEKFYEFSYTVPATYNISRINLIGFMQNFNTDPQKRKVHNSSRIAFNNIGSLSVSNPLALDQAEIFPNPVTDFVEVNIPKSPTAHYTAELYDLNGKLLRKELVNASRFRIDMKEIIPGNYLLRIYDHISSRTFDLVKK
jgi:hypothetical protein